MKNKARRWYLTPCGLDCHPCSIRLRTKEELNYWARQSVDLDKIRCDGCRSDRKKNHWSPKCDILQCCVYKRKLEFCAECSDFPCEKIKDWAREYEHHAAAVQRLEDMKNRGIEEWLQEHNIPG
jgi:hypothetical protein